MTDAMQEAAKALCKHTGFFPDGFDGCKTYSEEARAKWRQQAIDAAAAVVTAYFAALATGDLVLVDREAINARPALDPATLEACAKVARSAGMVFLRRGDSHTPQSPAAKAAFDRADGAFTAEDAIRALATPGSNERSQTENKG